MAEKIENPGAAWDAFVEDELHDEESERMYALALAKVAATSALASALERAREVREVTKVEVGRRMEVHPSAVSRLFVGEEINPTFSTIFDAAAALRLHITVAIDLDETSGDDPVEVVASF